MKASYDSATKRLSKEGRNTGKPRIWVVEVYLYFKGSTKAEAYTFTCADKLMMSEMSAKVDEFNLALIVEKGLPITRIRWLAIAR